MKAFQLFANACSAAVLPFCFFTHAQYGERWVDMVVIAVNIFVILNKLDSIEDRLTP